MSCVPAAARIATSAMLSLRWAPETTPYLPNVEKKWS